MNNGPLISSSVGRLIACTCPQTWPLLSPKSRYHLPPGHASSFMGIGVPSVISLCGPSCSSSAVKVASSGARTWISSVMFSVKSSMLCAVGIMAPPWFQIRPYAVHFSLGTCLHAIQLVPPEALERARPLVQRPDPRGVDSIQLLPAFAPHLN